MTLRTYASVPSGRARYSGGTACAPRYVGSDVDRPLLAQRVRHREQPQLGRQVQPVARLRLDGGHAVAEHLVQPSPAVGGQLLLARESGGGDGREDPAAGGQDLEVARAALAEDELALARAREQEVRVRVDEPGRHDPAVGVEAREPRERHPVALEACLDLVPGTHGDHPAVPGRDDGRLRRTRATDRAPRRAARGRPGRRPAGCPRRAWRSATRRGSAARGHPRSIDRPR